MTPAKPLRLGPVEVGAPVVLAPMAGVTSAPFRLLCRQYGPGLFVSEMVTSRALVEGVSRARTMLFHAPGESPRSVQLYGTNASVVGAACRLVGAQDLADHIDLNFGCPVPKVTRKGGGAALPWKRQLFADIVAQAVDSAGAFNIPVTVKLRMGIDATHLTYLEAADAAARLGVAGIALHARTAAEHYSGRAHWDAIAQLKREISSVPILGNGDIWSAEDALAMMQQTGCDGVVIGRGCQGRPWLFADLAAALAGSPDRVRPTLGEVAGIVRRHSELTVHHVGDEAAAMRSMRHHMPWYLRGYPVGGQTRAAFSQVASLAELDTLLEQLDQGAPCPPAAEGPRGRAGGPKVPALPHGWLNSRDLPPTWQDAQAELPLSGG
ncbi:MAG: tRNA dihydrouridine synthase DusB [Bifidobacteriaceae bacterium]|jgi:nifR3 family TIM-barrel protein|nr:tRNA dihydrouridine synthase DusB [Bifidobacteriaceae bacterium]